MHGLHKFLLLQVLACLGPSARGSEIINGEKVPENSMQYMASVQNEIGHVCGGFLVSEDFVLTAAHCDVSNYMKVVLGTHNLRMANDDMIYSVKKCKHPDFVSVSSGNDIMLLKLSRKAELTNGIQIIPLPSHPVIPKENANCRVAGWGLTKTGHLSVDALQMVDVPVINLKICQKEWSNALPANVLCAGGYGTNKGFCQGDSGGPLVCNGTAVGVVSFNKFYNCVYPNLPNVYTDVSKYLPWINKILKDKNC